MNVIFHTTTAIAIAVLVTDTERMRNAKNICLTTASAFLVGLISHGALDYIPHCYPVNSKLDAIAGLSMILIVLFFVNREYRIIMAFAFLGCVIPDLVDLSPQIINKQLGLSIPIIEKIFPWHLKNYSGSIYMDNCENSTINHTILIMTICIFCWCRQTDFRNMFFKSN